MTRLAVRTTSDVIRGAPTTIHVDCDSSTEMLEIAKSACRVWGNHFEHNARFVMAGTFTHVARSDSRNLFAWAQSRAGVDLSSMKTSTAFLVASNLPENELPNDVTCRICLSEGPHAEMFRPCKCKGSMSFVHRECLNEWRILSRNPRAFYECQQCGFNYDVRKVGWANYVESKIFETFLVVLVLLCASFVLGVVCAAPWWKNDILSLLSRPFPFLRDVERISKAVHVVVLGSIVLGAISFFLVQLWRLYRMFIEPGNLQGGALFVFGFMSNSLMILRIFSVLGLLMAYNELGLEISKRVRRVLTKLGSYIVEPT